MMALDPLTFETVSYNPTYEIIGNLKNAMQSCGGVIENLKMTIKILERVGHITKHKRQNLNLLFAVVHWKGN